MSSAARVRYCVCCTPYKTLDECPNRSAATVEPEFASPWEEAEAEAEATEFWTQLTEADDADA